MFDFFKKKDKKNINPPQSNKNDSVTIASGYVSTESAGRSTQEAAQQFSKPSEYDRKMIDDGKAKRDIKTAAFDSEVEVRDPYTGDKLTLTVSEAKMRYGNDWARHLAEADHRVPLEQRFEETKKNPWLTNDDIKASSNSEDNLEVVSRKFNNAKRSRSNEEFVSDDEYLEKTSVNLSNKGKKKAIENEKRARKALKRRDRQNAAANMLETGHRAGTDAAQQAGVTAVTMAGIENIVDVIKGEKTAKEAIADTAKQSGKAAATGYIMGGGLTTLSHTLSNSSSEFIRALSESNVPGKIITAVMVTGNTLMRYGNGEITTQECLIELGGKGLSLATTGYSMAVGQALIPIPIVGAAVGALVGATVTGNYYNQLIAKLESKEIKHQERLRIIKECEIAERKTREFREELETYLKAYFYDYRSCFDEALNTIHISFETGNADGVIAGANQITRKLGGQVDFNSMEEFDDFMNDDLSTFIL